MTHFVSDTVYDVALNYIKNNATKVVLCEGAPTTYSDANTDNGTGTGTKIAEITVDSDDFTLANHTSGRKVTCVELVVTVTAAGDADHVAWLDVTNTTILRVAPLSATVPSLISDDSVTIPANFYTILDAEAVS